MAAACCAGALVVLVGGYRCFAPFWQPEYRPVSAEAFSAQELFQVELNTVDAAGLLSLPGMGEAKAQAILAYREDFGWFDAVEQLILVEGVTQQDLNVWSDYVYIDKAYIEQLRGGN